MQREAQTKEKVQGTKCAKRLAVSACGSPLFCLGSMLRPYTKLISCFSGAFSGCLNTTKHHCKLRKGSLKLANLSHFCCHSTFHNIPSLIPPPPPPGNFILIIAPPLPVKPPLGCSYVADHPPPPPPPPPTHTHTHTEAPSLK